MKVSDIYGVVQTGQSNTGSDLNPATQPTSTAKQVQSSATGSKMNYGTFALIAMFGLMLGAKYGLEKRG